MREAELREIISKLEARLDPEREEKMRKMYEDERRRSEDFYQRQMDFMREQHAREMERLEKSLKQSYEAQMRELKEMISTLQSSLRNGAGKEALARAKMFGRKSEKTEKLQKRLKKQHPGAEVVIRTDYSKQKDYTENAIYHKLGEYFNRG